MATILIAGDYAPKYRISEHISQRDYSFFDEVKPILAKFEYSIVNLECPVANEECKPIVKHGPNLSTNKFAVDAIKYAGFKLVTLANNHVLDYGEEGLYNTMQSCHESGIEMVGIGANLTEAAAIKYVQINNYKVAIINCCENEFSIASDTSAGANPLNPIRQFYAIQEAKQNADRVFLIIHGGSETNQFPSPRMVETYRFMIDAGADVVVNHHQHCFSGYEIYQGKPIFYGLGNFCFDSEARCNENWNYGYMVEVSLEDLTFTLFPYNQCSDEAMVKMLSGDDLIKFKERLVYLNSVIADTEALKVKYDEWVAKFEKSYLLSLSPFGSGKLVAAQSHGLLPKFISRGKILNVLNKVACESHRDIFIDALMHATHS
jgi:poly-gamma-glutamate synthesis protein (capsule biosynthesis protein)